MFALHTSFFCACDGNVFLSIPEDEVTDGNFHHIVTVYDQSATSIALYVDGICRGYTVDSNLSARNNSATVDLTFGGTDGSGTAANFFDGSMADMFYKKTALTADQVRKVYAAASQKFCTETDGGSVYINGKQPVDIIAPVFLIDIVMPILSAILSTVGGTKIQSFVFL